MSGDLCIFGLLWQRKALLLLLLRYRYLTQALSDLLDPSNREKLLLNKIGIAVIELIPGDMQSIYHHLQHDPLLIVEQLLMNMRVTTVGKAMQCIHDECKQEGGELLQHLVTGCDSLIDRYVYVMFISVEENIQL